MKIHKLDINLKEIEVYNSSNNLDFYRYISSSKLVPTKDINTTYAVVL